MSDRIEYLCKCHDYGETCWKPVVGRELGTLGIFGAHRWRDYDKLASRGYTVTHIQSGYAVGAIGSPDSTLEELEWMVDELEEMLEDSDEIELFDFDEPPVGPLRERLLDMIHGLTEYRLA